MKYPYMRTSVDWFDLLTKCSEPPVDFSDKEDQSPKLPLTLELPKSFNGRPSEIFIMPQQKLNYPI